MLQENKKYVEYFHEMEKKMTEELVLLNDRIIKKLLSGNTVALKKYVKEILEEVTEKKIKE